MTSLSNVTSDSLHPLNLASLVATDLTTTTTCVKSREGAQKVTGTQQYEVSIDCTYVYVSVYQCPLVSTSIYQCPLVLTVE
jgi:hypothetical protein